MHLIVGLDLDGEVYRPLPPNGAEMDVLTVGPFGLVGLLEERLGLPAAPEEPVLRVLGWERALAAADNGSRFYSASFELDPFGTARALLAERDDLLLQRAGGRLADFAAALLAQQVARFGQDLSRAVVCHRRLTPTTAGARAGCRASPRSRRGPRTPRSATRPPHRRA